MLSRAVSLLRGQSHLLLPAASISTTPSSLRRRRSGEEAAAGDDADGGDFVLNRDPKSPPQLFVVQPRLRPDALLHAKLSEALNLASSLEEQRDEVVDGVSDGKRELPPHLLVQNPVARSLKGRADTYFGPGTVDSIKSHLHAIESEGEVDAVFVNAILSGIQQRNLERAWGRAVLDRVGLIIEIFNAHAQTKEAKLQSELAALMYKKTRLVRVRGPDGRLTFGAHGEAQVVSARGRGSGGQGFMSGAGETELQLQKRRILERRNHLLSQIEDVRRTRALQRAARKRRGGGAQGQGLATVAIVGYTNAGKSTLVSSLSDAELYSDDRLFATVDPRLRSVILPSGKKVILSDTVGFISNLPVQLVEAFHATLEEVVEADLLVHVLDSSAINVEEQKTSVLQVLQQIGVPNEKISNMIEVWNKIDLLNVNRANELADDLYKTTEETQENEIGLINPPFGEIVDKDVNSEHEQQEADCEESVIDYEQLQSETGDSYSHESLHLLKDTGEDINCQVVGIKHVETSAITGVGLQELLHLIDEKLSAQKSSEKKFYDQKWRPYHPEEMAAVER